MIKQIADGYSNFDYIVISSNHKSCNKEKSIKLLSRLILFLKLIKLYQQNLTKTRYLLVA